uniref:helix-turn-helix transcriptional regulator n=1 Tax=Bacteroides cellulosilyticus TaxID=246787 RepID=UPI004027A638
MSEGRRNRIRVILAEQERTSKWLAEQVGKSRLTISRWTTNKSQPSVDQLYEIANVLNIDVRDLLEPSK